jgi:hypothetical protein
MEAKKTQNEPQIFEDEHPEKPVPIVEKIDYSGAHEKTDPKEIALVKKLDRWIMVCSPTRFRRRASLLTQEISTADALEHVLAQLP